MLTTSHILLLNYKEKDPFSKDLSIVLYNLSIFSKINREEMKASSPQTAVSQSICN